MLNGQTRSCPPAWVHRCCACSAVGSHLIIELPRLAAPTGIEGRGWGIEDRLQGLRWAEGGPRGTNWRRSGEMTSIDLRRGGFKTVLCCKCCRSGEGDIHERPELVQVSRFRCSEGFAELTLLLFCSLGPRAVSAGRSRGRQSNLKQS